MHPLVSAEMADLDLLRVLNRGMIPVHYMQEEYRKSLRRMFKTTSKKRQDRHVIMRSGKFYLFDVGVAGAITRSHISEEKGEQFGKALEHFILMEILAHRSYRELGYDVNFWRTKSGLEVEYILGQGEVAIEVKGGSRVDTKELRPLKAFMQVYRPARAFVVCNERAPRMHEDIRVLPWRDFLKMLWDGEVIG